MMSYYQISMSNIVPIRLPDLKSDNAPYVVGITELHPGDHEYVAKFFRDFSRVDNPYDANQKGVRKLIDELANTVHQLSGITHENPRPDPNPGHIKDRLGGINKSTYDRSSFGGDLTLFEGPVAENMQFAYGLMMTYGYSVITPVEFAVLLPQKELTRHPAILLSNEFKKGHEAGVQSLINILKFGWNYEPSVTK